MNIVRSKPAPVMGNIFAALAASAGELFNPKGGSIIEVPGKPSALNMTIIGVLAAAVVAVAVMKKGKVI